MPSGICVIRLLHKHLGRANIGSTVDCLDLNVPDVIEYDMIASIVPCTTGDLHDEGKKEREREV